MRAGIVRLWKDPWLPSRTQGPSHFSTVAASRQHATKLNVEELLANPTWSVSTLLPQKTQPIVELSSKQLRHLLRLSALPPPLDEAEEKKMLDTLSSQLHFVKDIQAVDTTGVEPLKSLRDETQQGEREAELGLEALSEAMEKEEIRGRFHRRIRRKRSGQRADEEWDVLGGAERKVGRYFVVEGGKNG